MGLLYEMGLWGLLNSVWLLRKSKENGIIFFGLKLKTFANGLFLFGKFVTSKGKFFYFVILITYDHVIQCFRLFIC